MGSDSPGSKPCSAIFKLCGPKEVFNLLYHQFSPMLNGDNGVHVTSYCED
jgi:hypothetical protein